MQFTSVALMLLLTAKLLLLPGMHTASRETRRSRWLMVAGTATLAVHFALQLTLGLRQMGTTQPVMLNLTMLIPASYLFATAVLLLQRRGRLSRLDWLAGPVVWVVVMALMGTAKAADGLPLLSDSPLLRKAEVAGAALYLLMQSYYTVRHTSALTAMQRTLNDYYDRDTDGMLRWMRLSIMGLMLLALMVPIAIFGTGWRLLAIAFAFYAFIFYLVDSFCYYLTSNAPANMQEAEENADEVEQEREADRDTERTLLRSFKRLTGLTPAQFAKHA